MVLLWLPGTSVSVKIPQVSLWQFRSNVLWAALLVGNWLVASMFHPVFPRVLLFTSRGNVENRKPWNLWEMSFKRCLKHCPTSNVKMSFRCNLLRAKIKDAPNCSRSWLLPGLTDTSLQTYLGWEERIASSVPGSWSDHKREPDHGQAPTVRHSDRDGTSIGHHTAFQLASVLGFPLWW